MASFGKCSSVLFALLVLFVVDPSSARLTIDDLSRDVCSKSLDPAYCSQVIKSIPGAVGAPSLVALGQTTIDFAHSEGAKTEAYIKSLVGSAGNPRLKEDYTSCAENYDEAVGNLEGAQDKIKSKDYVALSFAASACMSQVEDCQDNFNNPPTPDPSQLPQKNKYFNMLCSIILIVANKLHEGGA